MGDRNFGKQTCCCDPCTDIEEDCDDVMTLSLLYVPASSIPFSSEEMT